MDLEEKSLQPIMEEKLVDDLAARGEIFSKSEDLILDQQAESFHPDSTNINQGSDEDPEPVVTYIDSLELYSDSTFAQICSYFNKFAQLLGIKAISFTKLEKMFCTLYDNEASPDLINLHTTLLRKIYLKSARIDKWEEYLMKFCSLNPILDSEFKKMKRLGYNNLSLSQKLSILQVLCDSQFDFNLKFRENIQNSYFTYQIRINPIGHDKQGTAYYYQQDDELNILIWSCEPEDYAETSWTLRAKSKDELVLLIQTLRNPEFNKVDSSIKIEVAEKYLDGEPTQKYLTMSEDEKSLIQTKNSRYTFCDKFCQDALNKKKQLKEKKRKDRAPPSTKTDVPNIDDENDCINEDEIQIDESILELMYDRRILPPRNARSKVSSSIKDTKKIINDPIHALAYQPETVGSFDEVSEEEEEEMDECSNTSDDEFILDDEGCPKRIPLPRPPSRKPKKQSKKRKKGKRAGGRGRSSLPQSIVVPTPVTIVGGSSDEEELDEGENAKIIKKKATEKTLCMVCALSKKPDLLLLCDGCDDAWHTYCLRPQLWFVPDGDWFCPNCEHNSLIKKLVFAYGAFLDDTHDRKENEKRKAAAEDRLKREMDFIGISIGPGKKGNLAKFEIKSSSSSSVDSDEEGGQRRSKKKAMKKVMEKTRKQQKREAAELYYPTITVTEGRTRRNVTKVDYNFHTFDEQIDDAIDEIGPISSSISDKRPKNNDVDTDNNDTLPVDSGSRQAHLARPPSSAQIKQKRKLTDLREKSQSEESEEYHASSQDEDDDPEPSDREYLPSERSRNPYSLRGRRKSDDEFIDDNDSESEYELSNKRTKNSRSTTKKRQRRDSSSDDFSESSHVKSKNRRKATNKEKYAKKNRSEEDSNGSESLEEETDSEVNERTETGRPLRRAAQKVKEKIAQCISEDEEIEEKSPKKMERPVGALSRKRRAVISDDDNEDVFEPQQDEEEETSDEPDDDEKNAPEKSKDSADDVSETGSNKREEPDPDNITDNMQSNMKPDENNGSHDSTSMKEVEHSDEQKLDPNKLSTTTEELNMNVSSPSAKNMNVSCPSANAQDHTVKEKEAVQTTTNKNKRKTSKQTSTITIPTQPKIAHTQPIAASSFSQPSSENFTQLVNTNFPPPTPVYYIHPISSVSVSHGQYGHATTSPIAISTSANNYLPLRVGSSTIAPDGSADSIMHNQMIFNSGVGVTSAAHQQHLGQTYSQGFTHPQLPPHMVYTAASSRIYEGQQESEVYRKQYADPGSLGSVLGSALNPEDL